MAFQVILPTMPRDIDALAFGAEQLEAFPNILLYIAGYYEKHAFRDPRHTSCPVSNSWGITRCLMFNKICLNLLVVIAVG